MSLRRAARSAAAAAAVAFASAAAAQTPASPPFAPEAIRKGATIFEQNCSPCHGAHMQDPQAAFDLRKFPPDEKGRFVNSVTKGKNAMPPWGDLLRAGDVEALWAYVIAGEKR